MEKWFIGCDVDEPGLKASIGNIERAVLGLGLARFPHKAFKLNHSKQRYRMKKVQLKTRKNRRVCEGLRLLWKELRCVQDIEAICNEPSKN
jgi:hypothetical protein